VQLPAYTGIISCGFSAALLFVGPTARSDDEQAPLAGCQVVPVLFAEPMDIEAHVIDRYWIEWAQPAGEPPSPISVPEDVPWDSYTVRIDFLIDSLGCPFDGRVVESSGFVAVDQVAIEFVRNARYVPAQGNAEQRPIRTSAYRFVNAFPAAWERFSERVRRSRCCFRQPPSLCGTRATSTRRSTRSRCSQ
jgi:TonB family protein